MDQLPGNETKTESEQNQAGEQRPVIPGLGIYSDSSDSETSDEWCCILFRNSTISTLAEHSVDKLPPEVFTNVLNADF